MRHLRLLLVAAGTLTVLVGTALAQGQAPLRAPTELKPFLLRASEPAAHEFPRTPSFSWSPVRGATRYEFQLAKNATFTESSIFWASKTLRGPAAAVPLALPWMTGSPYAAYARVRALGQGGAGRWSAPYGFNLRWSDVPKQLPGYPGLSRWSPVEGATGYEVWFTHIGPGWSKHVTTRTNAVDHREAYAFHDDAGWTSQVRWRVRAVRANATVSHLNGLPAVSYGPWSPEYVSSNPPLSGAVRPLVAVTSGATSKAGDPREHELTPAFVFTGREALNSGQSGSYGLYRVYVATDSDCVNVVFKGAVVGSPAYAPRTSGPLALPIDPKKGLPKAFAEVLKDGNEQNTYMAGVVKVTTTEQEAADGSTSSSSKSSSAKSEAKDEQVAKAVDLPESGWPAGRFYWTVVPVLVVFVGDAENQVIEYHELTPAQDQCQAGSVVEFGKDSSPVVAGQGTPYASGLSPQGRLVAASNQSVFYGHPLIAWQPVQGASGYEVQWSRTRENWRTAGAVVTEGTATLLPLTPGAWWYRVRAKNPYLPGAVKRMAWSNPLQLRVAKPTFRVSR